MKTKWASVCVGVVFLVAWVPSTMAESQRVENEQHKRFDRNRDGQLDEGEQNLLKEFERMNGRAEQLRAEANEHQQTARKMLAEADELGRIIEREYRFPRPESPERPHQSDRDQERAGIKEKAENLRQRAQEAKRQGRHEEAMELMRQFEEIAGRLEIEKARPNPDEYIRNLRTRLEETNRAADRAAGAGNSARSRALRQQAEKVERDLDAANRRAQAAHFRNQVQELGNQADRAQAEGNREKAAAIRKEAAVLKKEMMELTNPSRAERPRRVPPYSFEPFPWPMNPYPQVVPYPRGQWPYGYPPYGGKMPDRQQGLEFQLERLQWYLMQYQRLLDEAFQMAGEEPGY